MLTHKPRFIALRSPAAPPDNNASAHERQWREDKKAKQRQVLRARPEIKMVVERGTRLDRNQHVVSGQPVEDVDAQIEVAAETQRSVGEKVAAADCEHALGAVAYAALQRDRDIDRSRQVARFVERDFLVELVHLDPAARRDLDQRRDAPVFVLVGTDLARVGKNRIEAEIAEDRMMRI